MSGGIILVLAGLLVGGVAQHTQPTEPPDTFPELMMIDPVEEIDQAVLPQINLKNYQTQAGNAVVRATTSNNPANPNVGTAFHQKPDVFRYKIGNWEPDDPSTDLFTGSWGGDDFFALVIYFEGLINPPGTLGRVGDAYDPYKYGPNPVYGFVELDVDVSKTTGGEPSEPEVRYLGNALRFNGVPNNGNYPTNYYAQNIDAFDFNLLTEPYVDRSGEEYHIVFDGSDCTFTELSGNGNNSFDSGEEWVFHMETGIHRFHGAVPFSTTATGGDYFFPVNIWVKHWPGRGYTTYAAVLPMTNAGAASMAGTPTQSNDNDPLNQASIEEGLQELVTAVQALPVNSPIRNNPQFPLVEDWETQNVANHLDAWQWKLTLLFGMAYVTQDPDGELAAWTDLAPAPMPGDFNRDGTVCPDDLNLLNAYIADNDGNIGQDDDFNANDEVVIPNFGPNFSMFDLNYDGLVNSEDRCIIAMHGDINHDNQVNMQDVPPFVAKLIGASTGPVPLCIGGSRLRTDQQIMDINMDGEVNGLDIQAFVDKLKSIGSVVP